MPFAIRKSSGSSKSGFLSPAFQAIVLPVFMTNEKNQNRTTDLETLQLIFFWLKKKDPFGSTKVITGGKTCNNLKHFQGTGVSSSEERVFVRRDTV